MTGPVGCTAFDALTLLEWAIQANALHPSSQTADVTRRASAKPNAVAAVTMQSRPCPLRHSVVAVRGPRADDHR